MMLLTKPPIHLLIKNKFKPQYEPIYPPQNHNLLLIYLLLSGVYQVLIKR